MSFHQRLRMPQNLEKTRPGQHDRVRVVIDPKRPDLQEAVGKIIGKNRKVANLRESVGTYDPAEIKRRVIEIKAKFQAIIDAAEAMIAPPVLVTLPGPGFTRGDVLRVGHMTRGGSLRRHLMNAIAYASDVQIEVPANSPLAGKVDTAPSNVIAIDPAVSAKPVDAHVVYTFQQCIDELWIPKRRRFGKSVEPKLVEKLVGSKLKRLIDALGHDDMARVRRDDLETYFDTKFKGATIGTIRDHMIQIIALFNLAHDRERIKSNPAKGLEYSKDNENPGRPFLPSERDALIRAAWACDDETVKWLWLLGAFYGPRIAEFAEASVRDVGVEDGIPIVYLDTLHRKGAQKTMKTTESRRWIAMHSALRATFMERVERLRREHGEDAPLFPDLTVYEDGRRNKNASKRANDWLHKLVADKEIAIADADSKTYHSLRHTVSTALKGRKWSDFVTGHAARGTKGKVYEHPPLDEVVTDVETLKWPLTTETVDSESSETRGDDLSKK